MYVHQFGARRESSVAMKLERSGEFETFQRVIPTSIQNIVITTLDNISRIEKGKLRFFIEKKIKWPELPSVVGITIKGEQSSTARDNILRLIFFTFINEM
jgi:hypothetical protein